MKGYTIFGNGKVGGLFDDFVIAESAEAAIKNYHQNYHEANPFVSDVPEIELIIRTSFPFAPGTEQEVYRVTENVPEPTFAVRPLNHPLSRCLCCLDFFHSEEIVRVEPFGDNGFELVCELCVEENSLVPVDNKVAGGV